MKNSLLITSLVLILVFTLIVEDISWEKTSIKFIKKVGDKTDVHIKLSELGYTDEQSYENFRFRQIILTIITFAIVLIAAIYFNFTLPKFIFLTLLAVIVIFIVTEWKLNQDIKKYRDSIESDFPAIVEALTLSLSAGESPLHSMQRISSRGHGALAAEFSRVISEVTEGIPFASALDFMGRRVKSIAVRRFVDSVVIALTRGAPLIEVLHSHAQEARDYQRNRLLSAASKAELSMMVPVVFLILPISILFALWPSLSNLNLFAQS